MAEHTSPATEVGTFLIRLGNADRKELERASSAVRSDQPAWKAAGGRVAQIVASMGLDEQKAQLCQQARAIVHGKAAQIQREDLQFALWAAQGVALDEQEVALPPRATPSRSLCGWACRHLIRINGRFPGGPTCRSRSRPRWSCYRSASPCPSLP